jgi:predicted porin
MSHKKHLIALAALAMTSLTASAQSSVTVSGILDGGVSYTTGYAGGTKRQVISGIMDGSRLIFRGNEDIGGGYRALFMLENRIEIDTGSNSNAAPSGLQLPVRWGSAPVMLGAFAFNFTGLPVPAPNQAQLNGAVNAGLQQVVTGAGTNAAQGLFGVNIGNARFWDRQAYVGLVTPVGAVLLGRQYTPSYEINATFDALGTQSSLAAGQVAAVPAVIDIRQSNAVQYRIVQGGLTAGVMVAAGEGGTAQGRFYGAQVQYKMDGFAAGVGYNTKKNEIGQGSLTTKTFGASAAIGPGTVYFLYNDVSDPNPSGIQALLAGFSGGVNSVRANIAAQPGIGAILASQINVANLTARYKSAFVQDSTTMSIGYKIVSGPHTIYTAFNRYNDKSTAKTAFGLAADNADTDSFGVAYSYAFSKRTDVNMVLTKFNNKGLGQAAPGQAGFLGGFTEAPGKDSNNYAVGLRHRF